LCRSGTQERRGGQNLYESTNPYLSKTKKHGGMEKNLSRIKDFNADLSISKKKKRENRGVGSKR